MKAKLVVVSMLLMLSMIGAPVTSVAQTTVNADIGGTQKTGTSPLDISGTYGNITITQYDTAAGAARVEVVGNDASQDFLVLKNAKITASAPVTDYRIAFWATLTPAPNSPTEYQTRINGSLMRGPNGANGDSVKVKGWMDSAQIGTDISKTITCNTPPPCGLINVTKTGSMNPSGNRVLKGEFWVTMTTANDVLNLPPGGTNGVAVKNTTALGQDDGGEKACEKMKGEERKKCEMEKMEMEKKMKMQN